MKNILLIESRGNFGDQFLVYGIALITERTWKEHLQDIEDYFLDNEILEVSFGINHKLRYEDEDQYAKAFKCKEVTLEEAQVLMKTLGIKEICDDSTQLTVHRKYCKGLFTVGSYE